MAGRVAQVVDYLLSKRQVLSSISGTAKKEKEKLRSFGGICTLSSSE
jgi:hypothetical protein